MRMRRMTTRTARRRRRKRRRGRKVGEADAPPLHLLAPGAAVHCACAPFNSAPCHLLFFVCSVGAEEAPAAAGGEPAAAAAGEQAEEAGPSSSKPSGSKKRKAGGGEGEGWGKIEEGLSGEAAVKGG